MNIRSQKRLASEIMKVGLSRVRIRPGGEKEVGEAITRNDLRGLIARGVIIKTEKRGPSRLDSKFRREQKGKGRRKGQGSRKGAKYARKTKKREWIEKVRPLRKLLRELRDSGRLDRKNYRKLYSSVKGGSFRNKKHLLYYLKERELLKGARKRPAEGKTEKKVKK
jgi:large subunit ribosomal protein L19e